MECRRGAISPGTSNATVNFTLSDLTVGETYYIVAAIDFLGTEYFNICIDPGDIDPDNIDPDGDPEENPTSIFNDTSNEFVEFYFNNVDNELVINIKDNKNYDVKIYSLSGDILIDRKNLKQENSINLRSFVPGVYMAVLYNNGRSYTRKLLVQ
ncbi:T9SS type A sorting domain-containing protein [Cytophagaceae bacterium ABcell3]|nr:T9SS type A sorting domain-containing protein [Cytophagaceae bacterium ABcell3]